MSENTKPASKLATWIDTVPAGRILVVGLVIALWIATIILFSGDIGINICILSRDCAHHTIIDSIDSIDSIGSPINPINELLPMAAAGGTVIVLTTLFGMSILPAVGIAAIAFVVVNLL